MAIICCILDAEVNIGTSTAQSLGDAHRHSTAEENAPSWTSDEEARRMVDYRDILSLTRVLMHGPKSKADVDIIIERCAGAGHLRGDILHYSKALKEVCNDDDEHQAYIMDMGIKAMTMRRYFFLITFRSYLYSTSPTVTKFKTWMNARPELRHLCNNLRIDKGLYLELSSLGWWCLEAVSSELSRRKS
ncbi:uncharacterized protein LOC120172525 [Hibiscus syriacus]|uniref:uncharacterized protein LOC120172525 n=1 Tax=Hibiscus syriacus TaxID=106335 RepID=UPI0019220E31|nr:uncharacterized protein LOC120172525 [Hibiscus syriacus]